MQGLTTKQRLRQAAALSIKQRHQPSKQLGLAILASIKDALIPRQLELKERK